MKWLLCLLAIGVVVYLLYRRGIVVTKRVTALLFFLRTGKNRDSASLDSCTGWVRHTVRFRESGTYLFTLDCRLSKGDAAVSLLDRDKRELLRLNRGLRSGSVKLSRKNRYYLRWEFRGATGTCALCWHNDS